VVQKIDTGAGHALYGITRTRQIETSAQASLPPNTLMQRAGLAVAQLALALAPHARRIWIACGPGNNGGDGLEAALQLLRLGKPATVTWLGNPQQMPADTALACQRISAAGIRMAAEPEGDFDLCIDALLGIGTELREPQGRMANWMQRLNASPAMVLAVDIPSGLHADTGAATQLHVKATHTLSLLTLKPGLFTAQGRDAAGSVWLDPLGLQPPAADDRQTTARLLARSMPAPRAHSSHKGSFGDVAVVGGAPGMTGAALLAASAALHAGAGRVFVGLLDDQAPQLNVQQPELMFRQVSQMDFSSMTLVCGCGGGAAIHAMLPALLSTPSPLVVDADALNAMATDKLLQTGLTDRVARRLKTVLTPHPLEAARLLGRTAHQVQHDRLNAAQALAAQFGCTVVLKGSGTVIAAPGQITAINPTGNARLATAGTGDVLAGMVGAHLAAGMSAFDAACQAVYWHGQMADQWPASQPLTAGQLARLAAPLTPAGLGALLSKHQNTIE
jgi:hydroxyethylthiazole kinase-like uncharacterized protein yjeF